MPDVPEDVLPGYKALHPDSELKQKLAYAIDQGRITEDGYSEPDDEENK